MATRKTSTTTKKTTARKTNAKKSTTAKTPAKKTAAKKTDKNMSQIDAALAVLKKARKPMSCKEMVEAMAKQKLWTSPGGKTPDATLYAAILATCETARTPASRRPPQAGSPTRRQRTPTMPDVAARFPASRFRAYAIYQ